MKLAAAQLERHLQSQLSPVYVVSGDDPLLTQEATDAIRQVARQQGVSERQVLMVEANFDWGQLREAGASLSLFAERRLLELRIPNGKPGDKGAAALLDYLQHLHDDTLLLINLPRLDGNSLKAKWAKALLDSPQVQFIQIWPVEASYLPRWIGQRLSKAGLSATPEALELIAARVEGNLLAAAQEIEKLGLLAEQGRIELRTVQASVADSARYTAFDLLDTALSGQASHALHTLNALRSEGVEAPVILWALAREIRVLAQLAHLRDRGVPLEAAFTQMRPPIWEKRRPLLTKALQRTPVERWGQWLQDAQRIDAQIKGQAAGDPWSGLSALSLALSGHALMLPAEG